ncbi:hypothetical protein NQ315_013769 [Exocentrus adspersus]|uniref:Uncharacterized protein n=1 Tax=Exocentrus adspersus TaxID=1586481 RepID=A0AAV8W408_9CUCU|nr:hypothetical protein NQ315_013769 [Exocentrus adspersus]
MLINSINNIIKSTANSRIKVQYYDPVSKFPIRIASVKYEVIRNFAQSQSDAKIHPEFNTSRLRRVLFRSNGCSCFELTCGCCMGINFTQFSFNREDKSVSAITPMCGVKADNPLLSIKNGHSPFYGV